MIFGKKTGVVTTKERFRLKGFSLEMTAKDLPALDEAAASIDPGTQIAITFLPNESMDDHIQAAAHIRELGFEPMPHLSARRIESRAELEVMVSRLVDEANVNRFFLIAGDPSVPAGPFEDSLSLLQTGIFEGRGIQRIGIAGHPEGHPVMDDGMLWDFLERKVTEIESRNMSPMIVTQFGFDPQAFLDWLKQLRSRNVRAPVRLGVPGPTNIKRLMKYAAFCGVGASASVLKKYGISLTKLVGTAGPDQLVAELTANIDQSMQPVNLHFYPFGGLEPTVRWIANHSKHNEN